MFSILRRVPFTSMHLEVSAGRGEVAGGSVLLGTAEFGSEWKWTILHLQYGNNALLRLQCLALNSHDYFQKSLTPKLVSSAQAFDNSCLSCCSPSCCGLCMWFEGKPSLGLSRAPISASQEAEACFMHFPLSLFLLGINCLKASKTHTGSQLTSTSCTAVLRSCL